MKRLNTSIYSLNGLLSLFENIYAALNSTFHNCPILWSFASRNGEWFLNVRRLDELTEPSWLSFIPTLHQLLVVNTPSGFPNNALPFGVLFTTQHPPPAPILETTTCCIQESVSPTMVYFERIIKCKSQSMRSSALLIENLHYSSTFIDWIRENEQIQVGWETLYRWYKMWGWDWV